jgi:hypothetical protein
VDAAVGHACTDELLPRDNRHVDGGKSADENDGRRNHPPARQLILHHGLLNVNALNGKLNQAEQDRVMFVLFL